MGKIVIRRIAPVSNVNRRGAAGSARAGSVDHPAESAVFIVSAPGLDDKVGKASVHDGMAGVDISLAITFRGHPAGPVKSVRVIRIAENIRCGAVTGNVLVFSVEKVIFQLPVKSQEQAS